MRYNDFNEQKVSSLGFGTMRLPMLENGEIDYEHGARMVERQSTVVLHTLIQLINTTREKPKTFAVQFFQSTLEIATLLQTSCLPGCAALWRRQKIFLMNNLKNVM